MIRAHVKVEQLKSEHGSPFMNVMNELHGGVGVWGCIDKHLYLIVSGHNYTLVQFDDEEWGIEELDKLVKAWSADFWVRITDLVDFMNRRQESLLTMITSESLAEAWGTTRQDNSS